ncbi:iron complex outermembrane receptor protein [Paraburkholderia bannensis]|uniref:Iron complex outermembrane receptor protein n=1 Tax=Paraburkholderia bannensis TaxID=765414 RepID=A0A7W9WQQ9_9BURK|nr:MULTISPECIES: TonB-dependent receptor [Paraburkholderia]MBB3257259.1 iron complex outermembrane receptor protein [Paraburkholderia sp. WP4_3_2]MBB6102345.1 iron complex outermembrane receptor protein [Paraburkholderia bannensis]
MNHSQPVRRTERSLARPLQIAVWLAFAAAAQCAFAQTDSTDSGAASASASTSTATSRNGTEQSLPAVKVSASSADDSPLHLTTPVSNGALGTRSQLDTPFSTTVVTGEDLANRQANKLGDVFAGDASVTDNSNAYSAWATYITIRGLPIDWQNGFKIDGNPFISYGITMPYENLERVELLKGAGGFMYGFAQPGGVVNYVTKKPGKDPVTSIDIGYRMDGVISEHADLSRRFGPDGMFGARINYTHEAGKTYNAGDINRNSVALALDGQLTRDLDVYFNAIYQTSRSSGQTPAIYISPSYAGTSLPATISGGSNLLNSAGQHLNTSLQLYTAGVKYQIAPDWTFNTSASYSKSARDRNESTLTLANQAGNYSDSRWNGDEGHQDIYWQGSFEGKVKTGPFTHQLVFGASVQRQTNDYNNAQTTAGGVLGSGNLYVQNPYVFYSGSGLEKYRASEINQKALFLSDTMQLTSRWSLLAGLRYTNYDQDTFAESGATTASYGKNGVITPTFALMYKLDALTTIYASYLESLEAGQIVSSSYANGGSVLNPLRSRQYEVGIKTERARWSANAALFRIERGASYANSQNVLMQDGNSIYEGVEAGGSVRLGRSWQVGGDIMLLDTWYAKGQSYNGKRVAGAPQFTAAARVSYDVPFVPGLQLGADAKYTGNTSVRPAGDLETGGYMLVNLGANYMTRIGGHDVTLRAAIDNLTNRRYWMFQYDSYIAPGDPRTVSLNAKIDF